MQHQTAGKNPFPNRDLDNYFFTTPALRLRLDLVQELVRRNESPVLILGESGVGKSTLLNQLVCRADHNWRIVRVPAVRSFSADDIVTFLNAELRLATRGSDEQKLAAFDGLLERLCMRGQTIVIVVDNAHNLNDQGLLRLARLREEMRTKNLCILMTGEPALRVRMKTLLGKRETAASVHAVNIPCLDQREVASYIDMRLYHAGLEGPGPFNRRMIDDIARSSRGYPGKINTIASGLLNGERKKLQWLRASQRVRQIMRHWLSLAVVAISIVIGSIAAPGSIRPAGGGTAVAYTSGLPIAGRNRRDDKKRNERSIAGVATRAVVMLRAFLPRLWGNGR